MKTIQLTNTNERHKQSYCLNVQKTYVHLVLRNPARGSSTTEEVLEREASISIRLRLLSLGTFKADSSTTEESSPASTRKEPPLGPVVKDR